MGRILIVEDDPAIREVVRTALDRAGFTTLEAADGAAALAQFAVLRPDLVVLDTMLPGQDGSDLSRALRQKSRVPIVFVSSRDAAIERVVGVDPRGSSGARGLLARVRAVLRRLIPAPPPPPPEVALSHGRLQFDPQGLRVSWDGQAVALTTTELGLMRTLLSHPERAFSREELMDRAYARERIFSDRSVDGHVRRLRVKFAALGAAPIETLPGVGYRLGACE